MKNKLALDDRYYDIFEEDGYFRARIVKDEKDGLCILRVSKSKRDKLICPLCTDGKKCFKSSQFIVLLYAEKSNLELRNPNFDYQDFHLYAKACSKTGKKYLVNNTIGERIFYRDSFTHRCFNCNSDEIKLAEQRVNNLPFIYDKYFFRTYLVYVCNLCGAFSFVVEKNNAEAINLNTGLPHRFVL